MMSEGFVISDTDDDMNYRRPKRSRADFRPPRASYEDTDGGTPSSPGRSQRGHSRDDVPMTDQTDDDRFEVLNFHLHKCHPTVLGTNTHVLYLSLCTFSPFLLTVLECFQ